MDKILVHICCGVDSVYALRKLKEDFPNSELIGYFYDPNIHPEEEFELRWIETKRVCSQLGIECIKGDYDLDSWLSSVKGLENEPERGERCTVCHDVRLTKSAEIAKELGCNKFTTVLMMSPKKDFEVLKEVGEKVASEYGLEFLAIDFRKNGGTEKMNKLAKESELYHQNYCGCIFGLLPQRQFSDFIPELITFSKGRLAGNREELLFIKQIRLYAESNGIKCKEKDFSFIGWRLLSSVCKINKDCVNHKVLPYSKTIKGVLRAVVSKIEEKEDFKIAYLNKDNVKIYILNELKELPLSEPRIFTDPVFIVDTQLEEGDKVELQLKSEFIPDMVSQNLYIGDVENSERILEFYSDTDSDGNNGYRLEDIISAINENKEDIKAGKVSIIVYGAEFVGRLGRRAIS
jgi:predicted adenine nucleotide alpha hydrolase (AANH) superfamily ATPase